MKLEKEALMKHHFWIGLGTATVLLLALYFLLQISAAPKKDEARTAFEASQKNLKQTSSQPMTNESFLHAWKDRKKEYEGLKGSIWQIAWEPQKDMMTWPLDNNLTNGAQRILSSAYFGDDTPAQIPNLLRKRINYLRIYRDDLYKTQFPEAKLLKEEYPSGYAVGTILRPEYRSRYWANFPVAFEGGIGKIVPPVNWDPKATPTVEEAWLAQEDLWLRRGMLKIMKSAIDSVARCAPVLNPKTGKNDWPIPAGREATVMKRRRFRNMNWELDILIEKADGKVQVSADSTIKNISPTKQPRPLVHRNQGLVFIARQKNQARYLSPIVGVILPHGQSTRFKAATTSDTLNFAEDFSLDQFFTVDTSPIKRILAMEIANERAQSQRTYLMELVRGEVSPKIKPKEETEEGGLGGEGGSYGMSAPPGGSIAMPGIEGGPGGLPGTGATAPENMDVTQNRIPRSRYLVANHQVRRIPVAFAVVVDQAYKEDILAAVANSRLKIQTTQVLWQRHNESSTTGSPTVPGYEGSGPGSIPPPGSGEFPPGSGFPPGGGSSIPPGEVSPPGEEIPSTGFPGSFPGIGEPGSEVKQEPPQQTGLIEMAVYGIASLYERFPPRKPKEPEGEGTGETGL